MKLSEADSRDFQLLWKQETGQDISSETARVYAENLLGLVQLVVDPLILKREVPP